MRRNAYEYSHLHITFSSKYAWIQYNCMSRWMKAKFPYDNIIHLLFLTLDMDIVFCICNGCGLICLAWQVVELIHHDHGLRTDRSVTYLAFSAHLDTYRRSTVSCFEVLYSPWSFLLEICFRQNKIIMLITRDGDRILKSYIITFPIVYYSFLCCIKYYGQT